MKSTLVVFAVLLLVLTLISAFGGSIRPKETFYADVEEDPMGVEEFEAQKVTLTLPQQKEDPKAVTSSIMPPPKSAVAQTVNAVAGIPEPYVDGDGQFKEEFALF